jgi:hypothetical protein
MLVVIRSSALSARQMGTLDSVGIPPWQICMPSFWKQNILDQKFKVGLPYLRAFTSTFNGASPMTGTQIALCKKLGIAMPKNATREWATQTLAKYFPSMGDAWWLIRELHWRYRVPLANLQSMTKEEAEIRVRLGENGENPMQSIDGACALVDENGDIVCPFAADQEGDSNIHPPPEAPGINARLPTTNEHNRTPNTTTNPNPAAVIHTSNTTIPAASITARLPTINEHNRTPNTAVPPQAHKQQ